MSKTYNIFISHSWSYGDAYEKLIDFFNSDPYFYFKDYSVPKDNPIHNAPNSAVLFEAIKQQISPCHVVLIMAGKYATYSTWIEKEIRISKDSFLSSKPIVAVRPWGNLQTSSTVRNAADIEVGWNASSIISAIRQVAI